MRLRALVASRSPRPERTPGEVAQPLPEVATDSTTTNEPVAQPPPNLDASVRAFLRRWTGQAWRRHAKIHETLALYHERVTVMFAAIR
jgi:hypothetical protein